MMRPPKPVTPRQGQESVWDYPRPPALERTPRRIRVVFNGVTIVDSTRAWRVLETSHPPLYFVPREDVRMEHLTPARRSSFCEWKGRADYFTVTVGDRAAPRAVFTYVEPTRHFGPIAGYLSFYAGPMDACYVDEERVTPQPGEFYSGWITKDVVGPFKGGPGSGGW